ncbi:MAG: NAD-dependent DNA ligase LigA, partial [Candidatus Nealsonbacteria bacterium]|nr:NAD-dependent DNA ligase LigA [Candidatus Nealsonbacteria bacterium]
MDKQQAKGRIEKLRETIDYHRYLYHVLDKQEISDSALDSLKKELFDLELRFPDLITSESPTQRIGGEPLKNFKKVKHSVLMISFNDAFSYKDMEEWLTRISKLLSGSEIEKIDFYCELKIDGLAIELIYENKAFKTGSTRGNGAVGEDITQNLRTIEAIPLKIREKGEIIKNLEKDGVSRDIIEAIKGYDFNKQIIVRGEAFISKKEFEAVNKDRISSDMPVYSNPRNLAAGSIRQLDPKVTSQRKLDSFSYELITDFNVKTHEEKHKIIKALGFKTNPHNRYCRNLEAVFNFYNHCKELRAKLPYEIDGVVVVVNSNQIFEKLGVVGKAPRGAVAFKFPARQSTTIVEDIKVQVGRTGALTPVAYLKPVDISGVRVSRATLHNEDEIERLGLKIGDTVIVGRAGDVIPDIIKVLPGMRTGKEKIFKMPKACPICNSKTERKAGEVAHYCTNPNCFAKERESFYHFASKKAFDIKGLGPKIIDKFIEDGLVSDFSDLFDLKEGDISPLERFAEKSAGNIIGSIQKSRKISLSKFIYALGIRNVGEKTAYDLAKRFKDIKSIEKLSLDDLEKIEDVGPIVAESIYKWLRSEKNLNLLNNLIKAGITIENPLFTKKTATKQKLQGLKFVLTGALDSMSREKAKEKIIELGGEVIDSVSKNIDYVLVGKEPG